MAGEYATCPGCGKERLLGGGHTREPIAWLRTVLGGELAVPCTRNPLQRG